MDVLTGSGGFLGWHVRALALARGLDTPRPLRLDLDSRAPRPDRVALVDGTDRLLHLAGVNRGADDLVRHGNVGLARQVAAVVRRADRPPRQIVYANSVQAGNGTPYGTGKDEAAAVLREAAEEVGATFVDLRLPHLFGEHGRPDHNSVVATFCHRITHGEVPLLRVDRELALLSAQTAAEFVLDERPPGELTTVPTRRLVSEVLAELVELHREHTGARLPALDGGWRRDLFNALRSAAPRPARAVPLDGHADPRGRFHEIVRSVDGGGQTSFSTTEPGVTRGEHFHRRKVERFCVVDGDAVLRLRRVLTDEVVEIAVSGDEPMAVDAPTLWTHSLVAVGDRPVRTVLWVDEPFDPAHPDTYPEPV